VFQEASIQEYFRELTPCAIPRFSDEEASPEGLSFFFLGTVRRFPFARFQHEFFFPEATFFRLFPEDRPSFQAQAVLFFPAGRFTANVKDRSLNSWSTQGL